MPRAPTSTGATEKSRGDSEIQRDLDDALKDTFPASDPVSVGRETADEGDGPRGRIDRTAPIIDADEVRRLARKRPHPES